jgi:hypothetical protein
MNHPWLIGLAVYFVLLILALLFNYGCHREKTPKRGQNDADR